jgi:hypothetical protein
MEGGFLVPEFGLGLYWICLGFGSSVWIMRLIGLDSVFRFLDLAFGLHWICPEWKLAPMVSEFGLGIALLDCFWDWSLDWI